MQLLQKASDQKIHLPRAAAAAAAAEAEACAREVLEAVPLVMQFIRLAAQRRRAKGLSIQQFRALGFVRHRPGASLTDAAEYLGLALPSVSRLIDGLVARGLLNRTPLPANRRQIRLTLRPAGERLLRDAVLEAEQRLAERLATLPPARQQRIQRASADLRRVFAPPALDA